MQLQEPFLKIIPKKAEKDPAWVNVALAIGVVLLVLVLVPFFLSRGKVAELEQKKRSLDDQIVSIVAQYGPITRELSVVAEKIDDFAMLFREHRVLSGIFDFLGSVCHPLTQFTGFSFSDEDFRVILGVATENFRTLGEQFLIFEENEHIIQPEVSGINLNRDGFVNAEFDFYLEKGLIMPFSLPLAGLAVPVAATSTP